MKIQERLWQTYDYCQDNRIKLMEFSITRTEALEMLIEDEKEMNRNPMKSQVIDMIKIHKKLQQIYECDCFFLGIPIKIRPYWRQILERINQR